DLRISRNEPPRHPALRGRLPTRLSRGRGDGPRLPPPPPHGRGSRGDAPSRERPLFDHAFPLALLHEQGLARTLRRAAPAPAGPRGMTYSSGRLTFVAALAVLVVVGVVIELIRRRKLQERYALLWIATGAEMLVLALWRGALYGLARVTGVAYPPSALY